MGRKSRTFIFIIINIVVSVSATLTVLWLWKRAHPYPDFSLSSAPSNGTQPMISQNPVSDQNSNVNPEPSFPNQDLKVHIRTIVGAGDLNVEYVEIINQGQNPANLTNWQLINEDGKEFTFPALILYSDGAVKVLSKAGTDSIIELFWQADAPIWHSGETARLVDAVGETMATYSIP